MSKLDGNDSALRRSYSELIELVRWQRLDKRHIAEGRQTPYSAWKMNIFVFPR